ncbi:TPA: YggU family protein [archaeon]|uniref:UPF0235 protein H1016_04905 n=1 Tax=Candidatus Naiadarchaeum limnaeum TaxID=2756139 RepID=A0A832UW38_9ARCH|nr:YggU family protein [Candidatus Naiadarchaeum limnaeum]
MELKVRVVPNSKERSINVLNGFLKIHLKAPATGGKANKELIEVLAKHFQVKKSQVEILRGAKSREKTVLINSH